MSGDNHLLISISKKEFLEKSAEEQNWVLFQALVNLDKYGCRWERQRWKRVYVLGSVFGFIGGLVTTLAYKLGIRW